MTFDDILEQTRPDQDNYDNVVAMSQRFQKATESPDFSENPFLNLEDAAKASRNPVNRIYNENDLKNITSDVGTIAWNSFRKGVMDLQSVGDKADIALGNTLAGISGNTLGTEMRDRAADSLMKTMEESRFIDSNYGDAETWTSRFVGGGMSMAEMLAVGAATGTAGLGAYVGTLSLADGALNDMVKYQEEHGNLEGYETDPRNLALDYGNAVFQVASELIGGTGRLVSGKFLKAGRTSTAIVKESLLNFLQESAQGVASDITEVLKGNKDIDVLADNALGYIKDGIVAGVLGGAIGGSTYKLNKNRALQNLDKINAALNPNATQEEIRQKSEEVFEKTEEQQLKSFVPELIAQNEAINDKGSIRDNLQKKVAAMYDEAEDMSEQQKAKVIEATTSLELENILYDSVERKIPLIANPLLQGEVNELGWFREGIPENRRTEIENLRQEYVNLRDELKAQNESAEKNYDKIEELETKIELFRQELPSKLQDLVVADRAELRKMLAEQRERVATSQAKRRMISAIQKKAQSAIKAQITAENKLAEQMYRGAEKAQLQREQKETAQQTKEAKIRNLQEQRDIARAIKNVKVDIARKKAKESVIEPDYTEDVGYNALKQQGYTDEQIAKMPMQEIEKAITTESPDITLPTELGKSVEFEYNGDKYKITRAYNGYLLEIADGKSAIEVNDDGLVKETYTIPDERNKGLATKNVLMAERLFGDLTITIAKGNIDAENFWFGLGYTKEIADRKFVKEPQVYHQEENILTEEQFDLADENARLDDIYPEYTGETIEVDGKERTVYNSNGDRIAKSKEALTNFWRWFGDSKVVDEQGRPLVVYHGSTRKFVEFDISKSSKESNLGAGFYFTDNEEDVSSNYEGGGADFDNRVDRLAEQIEQEEGIDYEEARIKAYEQEFAESTKYDVYLKMEKPFVIGGKNETVLTFEEKYNEETDEYEEPTGTLLDFAYALDNELADLGIDDYKISTALFERAAENGGTITANEINELLDGDEQLSNMLLDYGNESTGQLLSDAVGIEYDGFIDHTVSKKFGSERNVGVAMAGVDSDTTHYIAFNSNQIKSVENRGTYSSDTGNIYKQTQMQAKTTGGKDTYRGAYLPEYRFIAKTENMDASTLNHELAHDWGQEYFRWARSGRASESFLRSWGAVEKAIGITDNDTYFTYDASEKFARAYEGWLLQKKDWAKILKIDNDDDKKAVESMMEDYRQELVDIYESLLESSKYFKETFGEVGKLKPELVDFFERAVNYDDIDVRAKRGEITQEQAAEEKLNQMLENSVDASVESMPVAQVQDADAITQVQDLQQVANDTERFETEGGNKKALQRRLDNIALAQDLTQNDKDLGKYDSHRDMLAVAEQADEFVKNRREDALAIINGEMAEQDGLYASDLYTALEREANSTGDFDLIEELRNSKMANEMAKELGQRVAGFRNYKGSGDVDVISVLNSLDKQLKNSYNKNKDKADEYIGDLVAELKVADNNAQLDAFFDDIECR